MNYFVLYRLPWADVIAPVSKMAREGFPIPKDVREYKLLQTVNFACLCRLLTLTSAPLEAKP